MQMKNQARWDELKSKNDDPWGQAIVMVATRWADAMEPQIANGKAVADIAWDTYLSIDDDGISGAMYGYVVKVLSECWEHGEALRQWHNLDVQIGNEGEKANKTPGATLNPAFLNIEPKK